MNKRIITIFVILLAAIVVAIVARDLITRNPGRSTGNPYKLEIDSFLQVDPALIKYTEFRQIRLGMDKPAGISLAGDRLFLVGDRVFQVISTEGKMISEAELPGEPTCISPESEGLFCIGFRDHFGIFREDGTMLAGSDKHSGSSVFTALAMKDDMIFIADAGLRRVLIYDREGNFKNEIKGETGDGTSHGFIIPSPNFHLGFDPDGRLWVANPGIHTLQQYDVKGELVDSWRNSSNKIEGFSGCCNPAKFAFLPDGSFITSEKGLVRIKVYTPSGKFSSVVAAPEKFTTDGEAPGLAVDEQGNIIILDIDKKMLRFFKPV